MPTDIRSQSSDIKTISSKQPTLTAGSGIALASNVICVSLFCDVKWSTDTNTTYSADGTTTCLLGTTFSVLPACVTAWNGKQSTLVSGTNIKTVNGTSLLGSGDISITTSSTDGTTLCTATNVYSILPACNTKWNGKQDTLVSGTSIKTVNGTSLLGSGDIAISGSGSADGTTLCTTGSVLSILPACNTVWSGKQAALVSGTNIKTINGNSILGSGDLIISGGGSLTNFSESNCTVGLCNVQVILKPNTVCTNADLILCTKGNGSIASYSATNTAADTTRSMYSIDLTFGSLLRPGIMCSSDYSVNIGGCNNLITGGTYGSIIGGSSNTLCVASNSSVIGGAYGKVCNSVYAVISGGCYNNIWNTSDTSAIVGGYLNTINTSSCSSFIGSGYSNSIICARYSGIVSEYCNTICGFSSSVVGGYYNTIIASTFGITGVAALFGRGGQVGSADTTTLFALANGSTPKSTTTANYNLVFCVDATGGIYGCKIKLVDGTQGANKVLTSDANGLASWATITATSSETLGTAIASAATTSIGSAGNSVHITGTTTITSLGTGTTGKTVKVIFDGALILTHNATSLINITGANITTAAGDSAVFLNENGASGYWRMIDYARKSGQALVAPTSVASATSATTARCLTNSVTGYSANSVTCAITTNCSSIINTAVTCSAGWYTSAICNIACGRCSWITNDIYDYSGSCSSVCHSFGIKDATNANANVSCLIMKPNTLCFVKSDSSIVDLLNPSASTLNYTISSPSANVSGFICNTYASGSICSKITTVAAYSSINSLASCGSAYCHYTEVIAAQNTSGIMSTFSPASANVYTNYVTLRSTSNSLFYGNSADTSMVSTAICSDAYTSVVASSSCSYACACISSSGKNSSIYITSTSPYVASASSNIQLIAMSCTYGVCTIYSPSITLCSNATTNKGLLLITNLPTTNPGVSGAVWNNNGVLNIVP